MMWRLLFLIRRPEVLFISLFTLLLVVVRGASALHLLTPNVSLVQGLATYWKLDGNGSDSSGNGLNLTLNSTSSVTDHTGNVGAATSFNGTSSYGTVPNDPLINTAANYPAKSINLWFQANDTSSRQYLYEQGDSLNGIGIYIYNGYVIGQIWWQDSGTTYTSAIDYSISVSTWYHVIFVYSDGNDPNFIVNGQVAVPSSGKTYTAGLVNGTTDAGGVGAAFGTSYFQDNTTAVAPGAGGGYFFNGSMSDIRTYNRALTNADIATLNSTPGATLKIASGEKGLVGWWKLDGNAKDSTPYSHNGTISAAMLTTDRKGVVNAAYAFDGATTTYISTADVDVPTQITVSAWVKPTVASQTTKLVAKHSAGSDCQGTLGIQNGKLQFEITTGGSYHNPQSSGLLPVGLWSYVSATYDGSNIRLYINGVLVSSVAATGAVATNNFPWTIGRMPPSIGTGASFIGSIDDVRIYNRALSNQEITAQSNSYNSQLSLGGSGVAGSVSLQKGLVGWWQMNGNAKDATPYASNGTVTGGVLASDRKSRGSSAYSFSGSSQYITAGTNPKFYSTEATLSIWFNLNSNAGFQDPISVEDSYKVRLISTGAQIFLNIGGVWQFKGCSFTWSPAVWQLLTATISNSANSYAIYIDGVQKCSGSLGGALTPGVANPLAIGGYRTAAGGGEYVNGYLDDARIYSRALNAAEVAALYNSYD